MRKVMLLAAMLAMVLAAATPAFAQEVGGDVNVQYVDCSQVQAAAAMQTQYGDATAEGDESIAVIAQQLNITQEQVNACLGNIGDIVVVGEDGAVITAAAEGEVAAAEEEAAAAEEEAAAAEEEAAAPEGVLPETGGATLIILAAGALLMAGGLVVRRIVR